MKILLVRMAPRIGGAEMYNLNLIKGIRKYYQETELFFITNLSEFAQKIQVAEAKAFVLPVFSEEVGTRRGLGRAILGLPKYLYRFPSTILNLRKKHGIRLVVFQGTTEKIFLTPLLKILNFKIVWFEHGPVFAFKRAKEVLFLYRFTSRFADKIITVSKNAEKDLIGRGIRKEKVVCVHTGIDTKYFSPGKKKSKDLVVGFVGAICFEKGIRNFLKTAIVINWQKKGVKFVLVGEGPELIWAKEVAKKVGMSKDFVFTGHQEDIRPYLRNFSLFFFPTLHLEGLSLSLMEAMAMEIPVVARDIGGNRELVVHGKTGYLFKDETPEELADIIIDLLKNEKKRKTMGKAARKRIVKYFNEERWTRGLHAVFEEVVKE